METPTFISYFAEKIGKPVSAFTKADWQRAAMTASEFLDNALPTPKKKGRPKTSGVEKLSVLLDRDRLFRLLSPTQKNPVGRPRQSYGKKKVPIEIISEVLDEVIKHKQLKQTEAMKIVLRAIGGHASDADSVLRSVRTLRNRKQSTK